MEQTFTVSDDPRIDVDVATRVAWHHAVSNLADLVRDYLPIADSITKIQERLDSLPADAKSAHAEVIAEIDEVYPKLRELRSRLSRLYGQVSRAPAPFTADQRSQQAYLEDWIRRLEPSVARILGAAMP
jgi:hypothetical protein